MAYSPSNASTFNQLTQQGLDTTDAATQSGVSTNPGAYGYGTNSNLGAIIPGAGGVPAASGLTQVSYAQNYRGQPSQQVQLAMNATEINEFITQNPGFGVREISPGNFSPTLTVTAAPPTGNTESYGTSTFADPAQRAGQNALTSPQPTPSPFAAFNRVETVPIVAPAPSTFVDPAQRAAAAAAAAAPGQQIAEPAAAPSPFIQAPGESGRGTAAATAINANTSGLPIVNEEGTVVQGIRRNPETGETYYTDPPVTTATATATPAAVVPNQSAAETARLARLGTPAATPNGAAVVGPATNTVAGRLLTQRQRTIDNQSKMANQGDWRVRLSLAPDSNYLYNAPSKEEQGILAPLNATYGVIFPYTPKIDVSYKASYANEALTHSNYLNYFYKGSSVDSVRISCPFTAQDTTEAAYLLAVIHFFRSATKMFYGQDAQRGAPPPLVFLTGLGQYQFNNHPCVITSFEYSLPADVDYIRAGSPNQNGTDLISRRTSEKNNLPTGIASSIQDRLRTLFSSQGIAKGAVQTYSQGAALVPSFSKNSPTYVPTKIDISIGMYPIVTRTQASRQFSLRQFANGELVKQGFW